MKQDNPYNIEIISKYAIYKDKKIDISTLKPRSNAKVEVKCKHGVRLVRWERRFSGCRDCLIESGKYNNSEKLKGRVVTWGKKISEAKKGKHFSDEHKASLLKVRVEKLCKKQGISLNDFTGFPTSGERFRLRNLLMSAINKSIITHSVLEQDQFIKHGFNYTVDDLKRHLESKFQDGMSWDNYGEWHIDHIKPETWFNYSSVDDEEFKKCWALDNLQPMWAKENISKGNKYEGAFKPRRFYMLAGQFGCGKTTISNKLKNKFTVVHADEYNAKSLASFISNNYFNDKPILLDIATLISTTYTRLSKEYEIIPIFIIEDEAIIKERINMRGGSSSDENIKKRHDRIVGLSKSIGKFSGTADEVYNYLEKLEL